MKSVEFTSQTQDRITIKSKSQPMVAPANESVRKQSYSTPRRSKVPFNKFHLDIAGNYRTIDMQKRLYILTLVDNATGYCFVKATKSSPVGRDVTSLLDSVFDFIHKTPLVLCTDGGKNLFIQ